MRRAPFVLWLCVLLLALMAAAAQAQVQVSLAEVDQDTEILRLDVVLEQAQGVAGVDLVLTAAAEAFTGPPTWQLVDLDGSLAVNAEVAGEVRIAFAAAEGFGQEQGVLLRLELPLDCGGVGLGGREISFALGEVGVWTVDAGGEIVPAAATATGLDLTTCVGVPTEERSFSTLKAAYR